MNGKKILIISTLPPPIGGVTIHLQRLLRGLSEEEIPFELFDYKRESVIKGIRKIAYSCIVHINCSHKLLRLILSAISWIFRKKIIITWHGKYYYRNLYDNLSLRIVNVNLVLNRQSYGAGLKYLDDDKRIKLISAFIPPSAAESHLPDAILAKLNVFISKFDHIVATNAPGYVTDKDGYDLYGIDFVIEMISNLKNAGLIISDPSGTLRRKYQSYEASASCLFISEPHSFIGVMKYTDIIVRATTTDGDSLSVKEAVFMNKKVIATDCVERPEGCVTFKVRDEQSFMEAFNNPYIDESNKLSLINGYDQIVAVYQEGLKKCKSGKQ